MQIHELNNFSGTLGAGAYLAIDNGTDTGKISSEGLLAATEARIDAANDQITDLRSEINVLGDEGYLPATITEPIVQGMVRAPSAPYDVVASTTRLVMSNPESLGSALYVRPNGQKFWYMIYDSSGTYLSVQATAITSDTEIFVGKNNKIRLQFAKLDDAVITPNELKVKVYALTQMNSVGATAYFQAGKSPTFNVNLSGEQTTLDCTFPSNADFRIYHHGINICNTNVYGGTKFQLSNLKKLVWNLATDAIEVVNTTNTNNKVIELLTLSGESVSGLLSGYYIAFIQRRLSLAQSARCYMAGPSEPNFAILKNSVYKVVFPNTGDVRIYWNGAQYTYHSTAGESYSITPWASALVYNCVSNTLSVKSNTAVSIDDILMLSVTPYGAMGLLAPFFYASTTLRAVEEYRGKLAPALYCQRYNSLLGYVQRTNCDARIAFISDLHKSIKPFQAMLNFTNQLKTTWLDVIVNGGDTVSNLGSEGLDWYDDMVDTSELPILNCVGNHDVWYDGDGVAPYEQYTPQETYQLITKKVAQTASIVQPTNAESNGYNYYYKDFNNKVRVFVLDVMNWNSTQKTWLTNILNDAKTNGLHAVGVTHGMFTTESAMTYPNNPRNSYHPRDGYGTNIEAAEVVYQFMQNGGSFVCWLSGHTHVDEIAVLPDYGNQYIVAITTPRDGATDTPKSQNQDDFTYTAFDCVGVDTVNGTVKFQRVGADTNWNMVKHDRLCLDYINHTILS